MEETLESLNKVRGFYFTPIDNDKDGFKYKVRVSSNKTKHLIAELFSQLDGDYILKHVYTEDYHNVYLLYFNDIQLLEELYQILVKNKIYNIFFEAYRDLEYQYIYDKDKIDLGDNLMVKRVVTDGISREIKGQIDKIYDNYALISTNVGYNTTVSIQ